MKTETLAKLFKVFIVLAVAAVSVSVLVYLNYLVIGEWFGKNGPANLGSIEVSYVSMAKFLKDFGLPFFGKNSWAPFWYLGFPMHLFYTPLLPFLELFLNSYINIPFWEAYRLITGISYIVGPISLFLFAWYLSKNVFGGVVSALIYSFGPSIMSLIVPEVGGDKFSASFLDPRRFMILVRWGEGPHTFSLVFVPIVGLFFARFLKGRKIFDLIFASIFLSLTALSNSLGLFSAILLVATMAIVYFSQNEFKKGKWSFYAFIFLGLSTLGLSSFWYNFSFVTNFFGEGGGTIGKYISLFPWGWIGGFLLLSVLYFLIKKVIRNFAVGSALIWFSILFSVVFVYYFSAPAHFSEQRIELLPQALRYAVEVDLSFALLIGTIFGVILELLNKKIKFLGYFLGLILIPIFFVLEIQYISGFIPASRKAAGKEVDLQNTAEKKIADWLGNHTSPTERAVLPGNYGFYLNWFTYINQLRGGLFQASINPWTEHAYFQLANGTDPEIAKDWLSIVGAKYLVLSTPSSEDIYKDFKNLSRFSDMKEVYRENGDIIYDTDFKRNSLALPVNFNEIRALRPPRKGDDKKALSAYATWLETSSRSVAEVTKLNNSTYKINGTVEDGEAILVRMSYDSGWQASGTINGNKIGFNVQKDPFSFILIRPERTGGRIDLVLSHKQPLNIWLGYIVSILTVIFLISGIITKIENKWTEKS